MNYSELLFSDINHSDRKLFIGFTKAAFIAWKLTVASAINMISAPEMANTHQCKGAR